MAVYKINEVDVDGKIRVAHVLEFADDEAAIARATALYTQNTMHVWDGDRFVASVPFGSEPPESRPRRSNKKASLPASRLSAG